MTSATPPTAGFVHLHVHTEYSPLDGMTKIGDACQKVAADGQIAFPVTDHGNTAGAWQLNREAKKWGIKPLIGAEVYLAVSTDWRDEPDRTQKQTVKVPRDDDSAVDDDEDGEAGTAGFKTKLYEHLTIFATTPTGWKNLATIMDIAEETGFYMKPRIDYALLKEYSEGLIVLTGCLGGPVLGPVSRGDIPQARRNLERIIDAVGHDNVFVEIMEHGIPQESKALPKMVRLAAEFNLPMVATNDSHYTHAEDREAHEAWLAVSSGKTLTDPKRFQFHGAGYHVRTEAEMRELRPEAWWQVACDNTVLVAERFEDNVLPEAKLRLPAFPVPDGFRSVKHYIMSLAKIGSKKRYGDEMPQVVKDRLNMELKIIDDQGFLSYFLIVWDLVRWAREDGNLPGWDHIDGGILVGPGRGSAAGSVLSYVLEIVDIDPLENNLLFERFMEAGRVDMPDIDLDFEQRYVDRVRAYLAYKWGHDKVARIGTHGVAKTRAAIKDAARVLDLSAVGARLTKVVPIGGAGNVFEFKDLEDINNGASERYRTELAACGEDGAKVIALAKKMVGTLKGEGIHACGIIISTEPLRGLIPLRRDRSKAGSGGLSMVTSWDAPDIGDIYGPTGGIGLLKLDVLSIRNLDIVSQACKFIEETTGELINPRELPHPNTKGNPRVQATYALLKAGRTAGVFQMDGVGMQKMSRAIGPESLTDLSAIVALFRPGPLGAGMDQLYAERKAGTIPIDYDQFTHDPAEQEAIASVLGETYGVWVFQEQLMRLGAVVSGFNAKQRAGLRKAVGKKDKVKMASISLEFVGGAVETFYDDDGQITSIEFAKETAVRIIDAMQKSAEYLFNASHSAAYAQLAYITAYLKANWPAEYGAAILATTTDNEKRLSAIEALGGEGIAILAPDVNLSRDITAPDGDMTVRLGLSEIKKVGQLGDQVAATRGNIHFDSLESLIRRLTDVHESKAPSIAGIEGLIESGACDAFGPRLGQLMVARAVKSNPSIKIPDAEFGVLERSMRQRARLGVSLGTHPLVSLKKDVQAWREPGAEDEYGHDVVGLKAIPINKVPDRDKVTVVVAGLLAKWGESSYSKGRKVDITIEGSNSRISGVMWDNNLKAVTDVPAVGSVVAIAGTVTMRKRDIEDEEGTVVEVLVTKELTVRRIWQIPVEDHAVGETIAALEASLALTEEMAPAVPSLPLLKLPPKAGSRARAKPPAAPPGGPINASKIVVVNEVVPAAAPAAAVALLEEQPPFDPAYDVYADEPYFDDEPTPWLEQEIAPVVIAPEVQDETDDYDTISALFGESVHPKARTVTQEAVQQPVEALPLIDGPVMTSLFSGMGKVRR